MDVQVDFEKFVRQEFNIAPNKERILLAVSGGVDSIVMLHLFASAGFQLAVAHCNFKLRGDASDQDELFVQQMAKKNNIPCFTQQFDTETFADEHNFSIQMAARELRYNWFEELMIKEKYDLVAVAHHQDDAVETFFINILRGTGLTGLTSIPLKNNNVIRPLMCFSRAQIETYAGNEKIPFREDQSNASTKYVRNLLRQEVLPRLREVQSGLDKTIIREISQFKDIQQIYLEAIHEKMKQIVQADSSNERIELPKSALRQLQPLKPYLYEYLKQFGFNSADIGDIHRDFEASEQAVFYSETHRLIREKHNLVVLPLDEMQATAAHQIVENQSVVNLKDLHVFIDRLNERPSNDDFNTEVAYLDASKLSFPLKLRKWRSGDVFYPLGMQHKKKISDFFTDLKYSLTDKENAWLLTSNDEIVWVVGERIDDRYKMEDTTNQFLMVKAIKAK